MLEVFLIVTFLNVWAIYWLLSCLHHIVADIMTANEAQFWGAVIGAVIAVLGAYGAARHTIKAERRNIAADNDKRRLDEGKAQIEALEIFLHKFIKVQQKNTRLLTNIIENDSLGDYMMTLPRRIEFDMNVSDLLNQQLANEALTLELGIRLNNEMIEDFVEHYRMVASYMRPIILENRASQLNQKSMHFQHEDMKTFAKSVKASCDEHLKRAIELMAIIHIYAEDGELSQFKTPKELIEHKADEKRLVKKQKSLLKEYEKNPFIDV